MELLQSKPELLIEADGFPLREAIFADIRATFMLKHTLISSRFNRDTGEVLMRAGHALGWLEEALENTIPPLKT